ncbi:MAG: hypothetical protein HY301_04115 [Verrucomicrobia bacterium]|nr:hypothetical protein [Verrucomicrobiota bacterium]
MNTKHIVLLTALTLTLPAATCFAGKAADLKPALAKPGKVVFEEGFDAAQLGKTWSVNKGEWQPTDGALVGKVKKSDNHPAVLMLGQPNHNSLIQFSFKFDGNKGFNLSYNSAKGHLFRILITSDGLTVSKDKDKKDAKSKSIELGKSAQKFAPGQWHTMLVEVQGDKVCIQTDNGVKIEAANRELDVDKTGYRFVTGASVMLDDVKVWQAE